MEGWIVAALLLIAFCYKNKRARFWKRKLKELYRISLKEQRLLKLQIDKLNRINNSKDQQCEER